MNTSRSLKRIAIHKPRENMRWCKNVKGCIVRYFSATLSIAKPRQPLWDCRQCLPQTSFGLCVICWKVTFCCLSTFAFHGFENGRTLSTAMFFTTRGNYCESSIDFFKCFNLNVLNIIFTMQQWCHKQRGGYFKFQKHLK